MQVKALSRSLIRMSKTKGGKEEGFVTKSQHTSRSTVRAVAYFSVAATATVIGFHGNVFWPMVGLITAAQAQTVGQPSGFGDIVERVKPAVISVRVRFNAGPSIVEDGGAPFGQESPLERFFRRFGLPNERAPNDQSNPPRNLVTGQGSGFFISADGYAVTANHVVDKAQTVQVTTDDGKTFSAKVIGTDARTDVALIKVDGSGNFPYVKFAEKAPRIGDWIIAVGNPFGLGGTVTAGIVSARGRDIGEGPYDDFIQIDAPVNRGNSGGPTFNIQGEVIGVNTAIYSPSGGSVGIAFAIPAETVKAVVAQLRDKGKVVRGYIGVQIQEVTPEIAESLDLKAARGALVAEPQANGPAARAGIEVGDVITAINGREVMDARDVARTISSMAPGTSVKISTLRKGQERIFNVTLGELPVAREANLNPGIPEPRGTSVPTLGLTVIPRAGSEGVVVSAVDPDGVAAERGVNLDDIILEVAGVTIRSPSDVSQAVQAAQKEGRRSVLMRVKSGDASKFVALPISRS
jgi:serine protease Do